MEYYPLLQLQSHKKTCHLHYYFHSQNHNSYTFLLGVKPTPRQTPTNGIYPLNMQHPVIGYYGACLIKQESQGICPHATAR